VFQRVANGLLEAGNWGWLFQGRVVAGVKRLARRLPPVGGLAQLRSFPDAHPESIEQAPAPHTDALDSIPPSGTTPIPCYVAYLGGVRAAGFWAWCPSSQTEIKAPAGLPRTTFGA
jgi:hypothetical protein